MPLSKTELYGTEKDNALNEDYCVYCYKDGQFTANVSMNEMIEFCVGIVDEVNKNLQEKMTAEQFKTHLQQHLPNLKRWKQN
jgi:hypothetical protein